MFNLFFETIFIYPTISLLSFQMFFGFLGYYIVTQYLMDKQIKSFLPKTIFTLTFMCSLGLLLMYLYEIFHLNIAETCWDFILAILVIMSVIVIPLCLFFRIPFITYSFKIKNQKIPILAISVVILYLYILNSWYDNIKQLKKINHSIDIFSKKSLNILAEIGVTGGVYIMALMSAFGSIWTPYVYFNHIDTKKSDLTQAKRKTKDQINFIIQQIKNNKYEILVLRQKKSALQKAIQEKKNAENSQFFLIRGIKSLSLFKNQQHQALNTIKQKISFHRKQLQTLNRVHQQNFTIYRQIVQQERKHNISQTLIGKLFRVMSFILCVYSVTKIILTVWNMFVGRKLSTDPITRFFSFITWLSGSKIDAEIRLYLQYISFGFMGYLMISNVRSFSMNIKNFFDLIFRRRRLNIVSTDTLVLLLSEMYGIYFLSAAILLQSGLPRIYVTNFEQITGKVLLVEHFTLFDKLYFWCCIISAVFVMICHYQRADKIKTIINEKVDMDKKFEKKQESPENIKKLQQ